MSHSLPMVLCFILDDKVEFHLIPTTFMVSAAKFGEERFIWVHSHRHFSPWLAGYIAMGLSWASHFLLL